MIGKICSVIKDHIKANKVTYLSLFVFYVIGIFLGANSVNDLDYQQKDEMVNFFNGFIKLLDSKNLSRVTLFKISFLDNLKIIALFWFLGFTVIGFPIYYIAIGMRGFSTGFSTGIIMGVLGTKGVLVSVICFLPKEIIVIPCLIAIAVNGMKMSKTIVKSCLKKRAAGNGKVRDKIMPYSFVSVFFALFIFVAAIFEAFVSVGALGLLKI